MCEQLCQAPYFNNDLVREDKFDIFHTKLVTKALCPSLN